MSIIVTDFILTVDLQEVDIVLEDFEGSFAFEENTTKMRLINVKTGHLEQFFGSSIPRYVILSHTWGSDEISFQDVEHIAKHGRGFPSRKARKAKKLAGYSKIVDFCAKIVERCSDIEYAWIDTCCIDKASSAELSEAINSMFQWYEQAEECFAYLCDVAAGQDPKAVGSNFRKSRWFTRGWTLQELLAPFRVVFFDSGWNKIGSRDSLGSVIEEVTGISSAYISGTADKSTGFYRNRRVLLLGASVAERMSWAARRETTREEDIAYCLLGLFEIHMPLLYGEGGKAFPRLQEEIMKVSGDSSLLTWRYRLLPNAYYQQHTGILAPLPAEFVHCRDVVPCEVAGHGRISFSMTQYGLQIILPCRPDPNYNGLWYGVLNCGIRKEKMPKEGDEQDVNDYCEQLLALPLISTVLADKMQGLDGEFIRENWCIPMSVSREFLRGSEAKSICIRRSVGFTSWRNHLDFRLDLPPAGYLIAGTYPPQPLLGKLIHFQEHGSDSVRIKRRLLVQFNAGEEGLVVILDHSGQAHAESPLMYPRILGVARIVGEPSVDTFLGLHSHDVDELVDLDMLEQGEEGSFFLNQNELLHIHTSLNDWPDLVYVKFNRTPKTTTSGVIAHLSNRG